MNGNDLRVIKTRKNIETSFIYLLSEKGFNHLTVQDILEKALINRSTFYKHYRDKYDVAEQMCARITDEFRICTAERFELSDEKAVETRVSGLYRKLSADRDVLLPLLQLHTETIHLYDDMFSLLKEQCRMAGNSDYPSSMYAGIVMTSVLWCLQNGENSETRKYIPLFVQMLDEFRHRMS